MAIMSNVIINFRVIRYIFSDRMCKINAVENALM